jgi:hypothetical protein
MLLLALIADVIPGSPHLKASERCLLHEDKNPRESFWARGS